MNLPELYNRVTAKRPDLCVEGWKWKGADGVSFVPANTAAALILAKWLEALPDGSHLMVRGRVPSNRGWTIYPSSQELDYYSTPLQALAAFYLGDEK